MKTNALVLTAGQKDTAGCVSLKWTDPQTGQERIPLPRKTTYPLLTGFSAAGRHYLHLRLLLAKQGYKVYKPGETKKKLVYTALSALAAFQSAKSIKAKLDAAIQAYNSQPSSRIVNIGGAYGYQKEMLQRCWFDGAVELPFENTVISAPAGYIEYLTYFYGDYMTPPPENKRGDRHSVVELDFGPYNEV